MRNIDLILVIAATIMGDFRISQAKEVKLTSKDFQKQYLQNLSDTMRTTALEYLNNYLGEIKTPPYAPEDFNEMLQLAVASERLEPKIVFIKQYLDMAEHRDSSRDNMYGLRNVIFLKKLKNHIHQLQEDSFEDMHQLRYFYLCKQFKEQQKTAKSTSYHNYYSRDTQLVPINEDGLKNSNSSDNHMVSINITEFGKELYKKVNHAGADVINDYLIILRRLLQEVLEPESEEEAPSQTHSASLRKILVEIEFLLKADDFYTKRQRLYDYLENHLAVDYEQIQGSENFQHDLMEIFSKLKEKGLDLVVAFLFSNFEFIDYLQDQWKLLLPQVPISQYDERSRPLKRIEQLYAEFKHDSENASKYDSYLEAVASLHKQSQQENTDDSHIFEMLYNASQNVGTSRGTLIYGKCNGL